LIAAPQGDQAEWVQLDPVLLARLYFDEPTKSDRSMTEGPAGGAARSGLASFQNYVTGAEALQIENAHAAT
jgi:hypothetical protein